MYNLYFNNKKIGKTYSTYENARQMARKILRAITPVRSKNQPDLPMSFAGINIVRN
jgi:hypothetical protein